LHEAADDDPEDEEMGETFETPAEIRKMVNRKVADKRKRTQEINDEDVIGGNKKQKPNPITDLTNPPDTKRIKRFNRLHEFPADRPIDRSINYAPAEELLQVIETIGNAPLSADGVPQGYPETLGRVERWAIGTGFRNAGPSNTLSSFSEAVSRGAVDTAAYYHDLRYDAATTTQDIDAADRQFIQDMEAIPPVQRDMRWYTAVEAIRRGAGKPIGLKSIYDKQKKLR